MDSCYLGRPFSGACIPFFASVLLDCLNLVTDEYAAINSVCYGNPFDDCQPGGVAPPTNSELRVLGDDSQCRFSSVTGSNPSRSYAVDDSKERQASASAIGIRPPGLRSETLHCRRARQNQAEAYGNAAPVLDPV